MARQLLEDMKAGRDEDIEHEPGEMRRAQVDSAVPKEAMKEGGPMSWRTGPWSPL